MKLRKEFDSIGSINVPNDKYWGASTQRSNKFFNIGKILVNISIIKSIAIIKKSAAADFLIIAIDLMIEIFTKIFPILKNLLDLWVDAPQYLSFGTFILPILSNSFLNFID